MCYVKLLIEFNSFAHFVQIHCLFVRVHFFSFMGQLGSGLSSFLIRVLFNFNFETPWAFFKLILVVAIHSIF